MKRLFLLRLIACIAALLCAVTLMRHPRTVHAQGTVIWSADHEKVSEEDWYRPNDASHGGGEYDSGCAGASPAYGFGRNPKGSDPFPYSLFLTMAAPCGDLSVSGTRMFRWLEPHLYPDLYYKVWYYFPQVYTLADPQNGWWNIMQWKSQSTTPPRDDPFFNIGVGTCPNGNMCVYLYESRPYDPSSARSHEQTIIDVPIGQWFYIEGYYQSRGDATGRVTIWQGDELNRTLLCDLTGVQTRYPDSEGGATAWSVNNYGTGTRPHLTQFMIDDAEIRTP
jgi:hypothetical protein